MRDLHRVILGPVLTEKSTGALEASNTYTFVVAPNATKGDIRRAVESLFDVEVTAVRTMRYAGKVKRAFLGQMARNPRAGRRPAFKKALVEVAEGDAIEFYDGG